MELDETKIGQIKGVFDTLKDYCTHRFECSSCPFEKRYEDGGGICKFRLSAGLPAYMLSEIFTGPVVDSEE